MANTASSKLKQGANEARRALSADGRKLKERAEELGDDVREALHDTREGLARSAREGYERVSEAAGDYWSRGRERAAQLEHEVEHYLARRPLSSVLVAAGIGFVAALLLIRRR